MPALPKLPKLTAFILLAATSPLPAQEPAPIAGEQPLRYQAVSIGNGRVLVIDTATGRCWSKSLGEGRWREEGNPAESASPNAATSLPGMKGERIEESSGEVRSPSEEKSLNLTVRQRDRAAIPGSPFFVYIGDITEGRVLVSIRDATGNVLLEESPLSANEGLVFEGKEVIYELSLESLTNHLTGEDFAEFRLEKVPHSDDPGRPRTDSGYKLPEGRRAGLPRSDSARNPPGQRRTHPPHSDSARSTPDPAAETRKIEALIEHVEGMTDAKFVRNGVEYDGPTAAAFLREKRDAKESDIKTAADFIDKAAADSSTTGQPYLIRFTDGREVKAADYLREQLPLDAPAPATETPPRPTRANS